MAEEISTEVGKKRPNRVFRIRNPDFDTVKRFKWDKIEILISRLSGYFYN